jgi:aspartyl-tRNA(Asn)/glutamyl-tRNA(Gln) amidotransferase subunit A
MSTLSTSGNRAWHEMSALELGQGIGAGRIDPRELARYFLDRTKASPHGKDVYIALTEARALAEADAAAARQKAGLRRGGLDGVPVAWKDLVDAAGTPNTFGSGLFRDRVPTRDAPALARATAAGTVCLGKTNLSEFAFSGLGINPTYGTPHIPFDEGAKRCPGGSSSGAGVSLSRGFAPIAIGSDTGGSVRIPAAFNAVVGMKTTIGRIPVDGCMALSPSLDTLGPLARDVADANAMTAILSDRPAADLSGAGVKGERLLVAETTLFDDCDAEVRAAVERAIERLGAAGARITRAPVPEFAEIDRLLARHGNLVAAEVYALWGDAVEQAPHLVYHHILTRMRAGKAIPATATEALRQTLAQLTRRYAANHGGFAAVLGPTVPILPPPAAPLEADDALYAATNLKCLRNTRLANMLGLCAITLPVQSAGALPVGLMLIGLPQRDNQLLRLAAGVERALAT